MDKPKKLYRGISLAYDEFQSFDLNADLIVPYEPIIDEEGRKCVIDGNEYGVYMSDNIGMVNEVYGNVHNIGKDLYPGFRFGMTNYIGLANIGIIYEIDTENIDVRRPFISSQLVGHYNNDYVGDEWIADYIPASSCKIIRIRIGSDTLHESEDIELTGNLEQYKNKVLHILETRRVHLEAFAQELMKLDSKRLHAINKIDMEIYRNIFGTKGYRYIKEEDIDKTNFDGILTCLGYYVYHNNPTNINFRALNYLHDIKVKLMKISEHDKIEALVQLLLNEIDEYEKKNIEFKAKNGFSSNFLEQHLVMLKFLLEKMQIIIKDNNFLSSEDEVAKKI